MKELLYLSHRIPFPPDKGDKIRSYNLLRRLAAEWTVHLGTFVDSAEDWQFTKDLDAICGEGNHIELIADLHREHPELRLWVDNGLTELSRLSRLARPVIGSESLDDLSTLYQLRKTLRSPLLSLDFRAATPLGPAELEGQSAVWPEEVIVMSLSRVGSSAGPDFKLLHRLRNLAPENKIYAAGGVRDHTDLERLNEMGINGALLSTALHQGRVDPSAGADRRYK